MKLTKKRSRHPACVAMMWVLVTLTMFACALWVKGAVSASSVAVGSVGLRVSGTQLQVVISNEKVEWRTSSWYFPRAVCRVVTGENGKRPLFLRGSVNVGTPSGGVVPVAFGVASVPFWQLNLILLGAGWISRWFARRTIRAGHCSACGYDLRGLGSGKCPECGEGFIARLMSAARRVIELRREVAARRRVLVLRA